MQNCVPSLCEVQLLAVHCMHVPISEITVTVPAPLTTRLSVICEMNSHHSRVEYR